MIKNAHRGTSHNLLCRKSALLRTELATNFEGVGDLFARPAPSCARAAAAWGASGRPGGIFRARCRRRTRLLPRSPTMASRDARDLESGVVASGVGPSDASDWSDAVAGHAGVVRQRLLAGLLAGLPEWRRGGFGYRRPKPKPRESISAWAWRVGEPVLFWTACTAVAAFSMVSMVRMTSSPAGTPPPPRRATTTAACRWARSPTPPRRSARTGGARSPRAAPSACASPKARGASRISCWRARRARRRRRWRRSWRRSRWRARGSWRRR